MRPPPFAYLRPASVAEAVDALARLGQGARPLAGGQTLVPAMRAGRAAPTALVDLAGIAGLDGLDVRDDGSVRAGALVRQAEAEASAAVAAAQPLLAEALALVGTPAVRALGTVCGSLANADPAAELVAVAQVLGATLVVAGPGGERVIAAADHYAAGRGPVLRAGEVLTAVEVPAGRPGDGTAVLEVTRRAGDAAVVGAAARLAFDGDGACVDAALAVFGGASPAMLVPEAAGLAGGRAGDDDLAAVATVAGRRPFPTDVRATAAYRRRAAVVLAGRALRLARRRAGR